MRRAEAVLPFAVRGVLGLRVHAEDVAGDVRERDLAADRHDAAVVGVDHAADLAPEPVRDGEVVACPLVVGEIRPQPRGARQPAQVGRRLA